MAEKLKTVMVVIEFADYERLERFGEILYANVRRKVAVDDDGTSMADAEMLTGIIGQIHNQLEEG